MTDFKPGQKWISSAEPELGIGQIVSVEHRLVTMNFDLIDEIRTYAKDQAPLTRVKFNTATSFVLQAISNWRYLRSRTRTAFLFTTVSTRAPLPQSSKPNWTPG